MLLGWTKNAPTKQIKTGSPKYLALGHFDTRDLSFYLSTTPSLTQASTYGSTVVPSGLSSCLLAARSFIHASSRSARRGCIRSMKRCTKCLFKVLILPNLVEKCAILISELSICSHAKPSELACSGKMILLLYRCDWPLRYVIRGKIFLWWCCRWPGSLLPHPSCDLDAFAAVSLLLYLTPQLWTVGTPALPTLLKIRQIRIKLAWHCLACCSLRRHRIVGELEDRSTAHLQSSSHFSMWYACGFQALNLCIAAIAFRSALVLPHNFALRIGPQALRASDVWRTAPTTRSGRAKRG